MVEKSLRQLGFSEKEIEVYLTILKQGKTTPARVAKVTKINRTTVYAVAAELIKKGVIMEDLAGKIRYLTALPPESMTDYFTDQKKVLEDKEKIAKSLAEELSKYTSRAEYSIPRIRFVEESDLEKFLYARMDEWNNNARSVDGICWGFQDHSFAEKYTDWIKWTWKRYKLTVYLLTNQSDIEQKLKKEINKYRKMRFWSNKLDFSASTWIMGEYLVMIITRKKPYYLLEIKDAVLSHNMREVFRNLWEITKRM